MHRLGDTQIVDGPDTEEELKRTPSMFPLAVPSASRARVLNAMSGRDTLTRVRELARMLVGEGEDSDGEPEAADKQHKDSTMESLLRETMAHLDSKRLEDVAKDAISRDREPTPSPPHRPRNASHGASSRPAVQPEPAPLRHESQGTQPVLAAKQDDDESNQPIDEENNTEETEEDEDEEDYESDTFEEALRKASDEAAKL